MKHIEELREMLCEELDKLAEKGELTAGSLETVDKLAHAIKSIDTIMAMEDYSEDGMYYDGSYNNGTSYARGRGRNAKRDSMGRYSSRSSYARGGNQGGNRGGGNRGGSSRDGYSGNEEFIDELESMMTEASNEKERMAIRKVMEMMEE